MTRLDAMTHGAPAPKTTRGTPRILLAGLVVVVGAIGYRSLPPSAPSAPTTASPVQVAISEPPVALPPLGEHRVPPAPESERRGGGASQGEPRRSLVPPVEDRVPAPPGRERRGALAAADGAVPDGTTVFDDEIPGVANLDRSLLAALRRAASDAADDGVELLVNSGWRSAEYQERLLDQAVSRYGSETEAARWVAPPDRSAHVAGEAVDIGPYAATAWLAEHGARYGLCQIYGNEIWHFELRRAAIDRGCPPMYADPTHDPRMQR